MLPPSHLLPDAARADKACLRAEVVNSILDIASAYASRYGLHEGIGALQIALAIAEQRLELKPSQGNEVFREMRRAVAETLRRLGGEATAIDLAIELDLLGE